MNKRYFNEVVDHEDDETPDSSTKKHVNKREETYVSIGTPLPEIEDFDAAAKEGKRPVIQARVHGEKLQPGSDMPRLHGAFTGGFSAGYFNTVGSKEGFTPSSFVSSRQLRAQAKEQKPADYMDEEDVSEHGIAPKEVRASETFSSISRAEKATADTLKRMPATVIPDFASGLADIITPAQSNIGIRLLIAMGWRHGQGAGLKFNAKLSTDSASNTRIYGCSLPPNQENFEIELESGNTEGPELSNMDFAPKDLTPHSFKPKSDLHGIGYSGVIVDNLSEDASQGLFARIGKRGIRGHAFGVGFEGDDPEDIDVYNSDSLKNYDITLEPHTEDSETRNVFSGWTAPALMAPEKSKPGHLEGFVSSAKVFYRRQTANLPEIPKNFKYIHGSRFTEHNNPASRSRFDQRDTMNAATRAAILEDGTKQTSIFDYIRPEDKSKLDAAVAATKPKLQEEYEVVEKQNIPSAPLKQFDPRKPFASDPDKQSRYEAFLQFKHINKGYDDLDLPSGMTEWERQQEKEHFERTARMMQPLSWSISQRFTRASEASTADDDTVIEIPRDNLEDNLTQKRQAVNMKMFGNLTRSSLEWHPVPLLCKRFNVRNPYPDSQIIGLPKVRQSKFSIFNFLNVSEPAPQPFAKQSVIESVKTDEEICEGEQPTDVSIIEERFDKMEEDIERPSMDIFAAIFGEESENEDSSNDRSESVAASATSPERKSELPINTHKDPVDEQKLRREEGISAFLSGIFGSTAAQTSFSTAKRADHVSHLDDRLISSPITDSIHPDNHTSTKEFPDEYGPKLPLHLLIGVPTINDVLETSSSSSCYAGDDVQLISSDSDSNAVGETKEKKKKEKRDSKAKKHKKHKSHGKLSKRSKKSKKKH